MHHSFKIMCGTLGFALLCCACANPERSAEKKNTVVRTDSAGVEILQYLNVDTLELERWSIGPEPTTVIGDDSRGAEHELTFTQGQVHMPDGRVIVAVANGIRQFDSAGTFTKMIARQGRGPGEFTDMSAMHRIHGDSLLAYQRYPETIVLFSPAGEYVRSDRLVKPGAERKSLEFPAFDFKGAYADGTLLLANHPGGEHGGAVGVVWVDSVAPLRVDYLGNVIANFGKRWVRDLTRVPPVDGKPPANKPYMASFPATARSAQWGIFGDQMFYSARDKFEIELWSHTGSLRRIIRLNTQRIPRTAADSMRRSIDSVRFDFAAVMPDTLPPIQFIEGDAGGNLWVTLHPRALANAAVAAIVFDSAGVMKAIAKMPPPPKNADGTSWRLVVNGRDINGAWFTTQAMDSDDRVHVLVYPIVKTPARHSN